MSVWLQTLKRQSVPLALLVAMALPVAMPAGATLRTIEEAYELPRNQVQLPGASDGTLTVRPCRTCRPVALRVTAETAWFIAPPAQQGRKPDGQAAVLAAFRDAATNPAALVYVYYEPQTLRVKRIVLDTRLPVPPR